MEKINECARVRALCLCAHMCAQLLSRVGLSATPWTVAQMCYFLNKYTREVKKITRRRTCLSNTNQLVVSLHHMYEVLSAI